MNSDTSSFPIPNRRGQRSFRLAAYVAAVYLFLEPTAGAATGSVADGGSSLQGAAIVAAAPLDQDCPKTVVAPRPVSRGSARGTLPDTGGGRSSMPLIAAAGLLVTGVLLRGAAGRRRRAEAVR